MGRIKNWLVSGRLSKGHIIEGTNRPVKNDWGHISGRRINIAPTSHAVLLPYMQMFLKNSKHENIAGNRIVALTYLHYNVLRPSTIPLRKVSFSTRARTQSPCTVLQLNGAFPNPVKL